MQFAGCIDLPSSNIDTDPNNNVAGAPIFENNHCVDPEAVRQYATCRNRIIFNAAAVLVISMTLLCVICCSICISFVVMSICCVTSVSVFMTNRSFFIGRREKQKKELVEQLLDKSMNHVGGDDESQETVSIDMSIFNLEFNDFEMIQEIGLKLFQFFLKKIN